MKEKLLSSIKVEASDTKLWVGIFNALCALAAQIFSEFRDGDGIWPEFECYMSTLVEAGTRYQWDWVVQFAVPLLSTKIGRFLSYFFSRMLQCRFVDINYEGRLVAAHALSLYLLSFPEDLRPYMVSYLSLSCIEFVLILILSF